MADLANRIRTAAAAAAVAAVTTALPGCTGAPEPGLPTVEPADVVQRIAAPGLRPPNLVVILADDLGYGDLGSYGGTAIRTPNLDGLAAEGVRFTDFHASDSVCTPSRAGLLTGRYAKRMGLDFPLPSAGMSFGQAAAQRFGYLTGRLGLLDMATEGGADGLQADEITLAEALKVAGYTTGMVGKWHLGDFGSDPRHHPLEHGFDRFFGVPHSNDMHPFPLYRDRQQVTANVDDLASLTRLYTEEAVRFIESSKDKPFFLYFAHTYPHRPLFASDAFRGRSAGGIYGDTVEELDWSVGQVLGALKAAGVDDRTLVMFTSDNGPWYDGSPGGLRGRKGQSFEGGHRVPFLARWPGRIAPGQVSPEAAMNTDLFPTCLALAGLAPPSDRAIDGVDIAGLLTRPGAPSPHGPMFFYHQGELESVRDGKWKYFRSVNHYVWPMPVNRKTGRMSEHTTGPLPLLFDVRADRDESYNVADRHADVADSLAAALERQDAEMRDNRKGWKR